MILAAYAGRCRSCHVDMSRLYRLDTLLDTTKKPMFIETVCRDCTDDIVLWFEKQGTATTFEFSGDLDTLPILGQPTCAVVDGVRILT